LGEVLNLLSETRGLVCIECGRCTGICPVSRAESRFSPRSVLVRMIHEDVEGLKDNPHIWYCLTCGLCSEVCPMELDYLQFTALTRKIANRLGEEAYCSHGGALQSLMRIMTDPKLKPDKFQWAEGLKFNKRSEIGYFTGCLPFFDTIFYDLKLETGSIARSAVRLLNRIGIEPALIPEERCCGHDLLWMGDLENFRKLAEHNIEVIEKQGLKKVVFSCPEGYRTFKLDYPRHFGSLPFEVYHIFELLKGHKFETEKKTITYQDPCRLSHHLGLDQLPRDIIASTGLDLVEMRHTRRKSICCGVASWISCTVYSKRIQLSRLEEARATGAEILATSCPKCLIHLNCAQQDLPEGDRIPIQDLLTLIS